MVSDPTRTGDRTQEIAAGPAAREPRPLLDGVQRAIFGFDYFISYTWKDRDDSNGRYGAECGRTYALKLYDALLGKGFVCFLDSSQYAHGQNWRWMGRRALHGTSRLVLILSPAVTQSKAVLDEVEYFKKTGKTIVPIEFTGFPLEGDTARLVSLVESEILRIREPASALKEGPTSQAIDKLVHTFKLTRQTAVRRRVIRSTIGVVTVLALGVGYAAYRARVASQGKLQAVINEAKALGARAEGLAFVPAETMTALEMGATAVGMSLELGLEPPVEAVRGLSAALNAIGRSLPLVMPEATALHGTGTRSTYESARWKMAGERTRAISFSSDGNRLRIATQGGFGEWNVQTGERLVWTDLSLLGASSDLMSLVVADKDMVAIRSVDSVGQFVRLASEAAAASDASFSPRGDRVLVVETRNADTKGTFEVKIYESARGDLVTTLKGHTDYINSAEFSLDGRRVVTASSDGTVRVWDSERGKEIARFEHSGHVFCAMFSHDGTNIVSGGEDKVGHVWRADTGVELTRLEGHIGTIRSASFSTDDEQIVTTGDDNSARVWKARTGEAVTALEGHRSPVGTAEFGPRGRIATVSTDERMARIWAVSPDASIASFRGHQGKVWDLAFSPGGNQLVSAGEDGTARFWSVKRPAAEPVVLRHDGPVTSASFSANGTRIVTYGKDKIPRIWHAGSGWVDQIVRYADEEVIDIDLSADAATILTLAADGAVRIWTTAGQLVRSGRVTSFRAECAQFLPNGTQIVVAAGSADKGRAAVIDVASLSITAEYDVTPGYTLPSRHMLASSGDGRRLVTTFGPRIYRVENGTLIKDLQIPSRMVWLAAFTPDSKRLVTTDNNSVVAFWSSDSGELVGFLEGNPGVVKHLAFSLDGKWLATAESYSDRAVSVWSVATRQRILTFQGHSDITSLAFSPNGRTLATAGSDGVIRLWQIASDDLARQAGVYLKHRSRSAGR